MKYSRFLSKMIKTNLPLVCPLCFFVIFAVLGVLCNHCSSLHKTQTASELKAVEIRVCCLDSVLWGEEHEGKNMKGRTWSDFTETTAPFSQLSLAINFGAEGLVSETFAPVHVFVSRSVAGPYKPYINPAHIMIFQNSSEAEMETISQRELRSASGLDFLWRSSLYKTCL